jgi:hypothetical protein
MMGHLPSTDMVQSKNEYSFGERQKHGSRYRRYIEETHVLQNAAGTAKQPGTWQLERTVCCAFFSLVRVVTAELVMFGFCQITTQNGAP